MDYIGPPPGYDLLEPLFRKTKHIKTGQKSFEEAMGGHSDLIFLDSNMTVKSSQLIVFLEQDKSVLTNYPLSVDFEEYIGILEFKEKTEAVIGLLNPLLFYPSSQFLKNTIQDQEIYEINISCHPSGLNPVLKIGGISGTAQLFQEMVTHVADEYPHSLSALQNSEGNIYGITFSFESFILNINFNTGQQGWIMKIHGPDFDATSDHTGILALNNEPEPRIPPSPKAWEHAMVSNLDDFVESHRTGKDPLVNQEGGLASIILNNAVKKSLENSSAKIRL